MDKHFQLDIRNGSMNSCNFLNGQLTGQYHTTETQVAQPAHLLGRSVVSLGRSMQGETYPLPLPKGREQRQNAHVLHEDGVDACFLQVTQKLAGGIELSIVKDGVNSDVDTHSVRMGILAKLADVIGTVANSSASSELAGTDVHGISSMIYGSHSALQILGGCQQFQLSERIHLSLILFH